ncbi:ammonium transporter [Cyanobium sp. ATX 6A2]|uniref:ammonium transporter n=1 Tax=Cyanobium sp. ATX 6A2 TaxID=2823700 RepID=UPI0020CD4520|nr:ammonium transporter [Cyanobium sp. ATX 6A2]MCP9888244.1 ammonium transporter [Cyanobium sp. ATX 6A2]
MTIASHLPRRPKRLRDVSLLDAPSLLLGRIHSLSSKRLTWLACVPLALFGLGVFNLSAHAAELPELTPAFLINNFFLFICAVLVIFMNAGFAMVEAGLCRQKNAVNILFKNLLVFGVAVTAYWFIGYKLMYNADWVIPGFLKFGGIFFDPTVTPEMVTEGSLVPSVDFLFQAAFAGTAATIVSGLVAERIKFPEFVIFSLLLVGIVYPILGSWQWNFPDETGAGGGWLSTLGFIDFAGSTVVHSVGAWAGIVGAALLGPRIGKFVGGKPNAMPGHNLAIATLGCLVLWIGWYGFNPGSWLSMAPEVPYIAVTTTLGAAGGAISATLASQLPGMGPDKRPGKPDLTMTINGILAGLVGVTAGCDGFSMPAAWVVGFIAGIIVVFSVAFIDSLQIDDPVGAFSVHGSCGIWATLAVGLFNMDKGLLTGHGFGQLGIQIIGVLAYATAAIVASWILWSIIGAIFGGLRVTEEEETIGLDIGEHGMEAYPDFAPSAK